MAIKFFQAFVIQGFGRRFTPNLRVAKSMIQNKELIVWKKGCHQSQTVKLL
jgi:hypothetical protein